MYNPDSKLSAVLATVLLFTAACTKDPAEKQQPQVAVTPQRENIATDDEVGNAKTAPTIITLPYNLKIRDDFTIRADRVFNDEKGIERRKIEVQVPADSHVLVAEDIVEQLTRIGFKVSAREVKPDGVMQILVHKDGVWIPVTYRNFKDVENQNHTSMGLVTIQWPTKIMEQ